MNHCFQQMSHNKWIIGHWWNAVHCSIYGCNNGIEMDCRIGFLHFWPEFLKITKSELLFSEFFWNEDDNRTGSHLILYRCQWGFSWAQNQEPFNCVLFHENLPICVILYVPYDMTHRIFKAYDHPFSNFCHFSRLFRTIKIFENPKIRCVEQRINLWWSHNAEWISLFGCKRRIIGTENSYNRCHESKIWLHRDFELPGNWCKFDHLAMTGEVVPSARVSVLIGRRLLRVSDSIYWA